MTAIILSIGDELILGQTVDTNSAWLSQQLAAIGVPVLAHMTVSDDQKAIERAIVELSARCDFLLISGGIGPTEDDLTRQALAAVMEAPLEENAVWMAELHRFFEARKRVMPPINRIQAMIPRGAEMIFNTAGTAAGIAVVLPRGRDGGMEGLRDRETERQRESASSTPSSSPSPQLSVSPSLPLSVSPSPHNSCHVFVTPGVPKEMKVMFTRDILPHVGKAAGGAVILSRTLHTFGLGESAVGEKLGDLMRRDRNPSVGTTVTGGVVSLRLNARFPSLADAQRELQATDAACRAVMGDLIYGSDEESLPEVVARLLLSDPVAQQNAPAVVTAESCTGGLIAKMITDLAGSSQYFRQGYVTYSNEAKTKLIGVPAETIAAHGAVSEEVVRAMAVGAQRESGAPYALAVTGIAGPSGGTPTKPVGTVWLGMAHPGGCVARHFLFPGDREMIRDRTARTALTMLRYHLLGKPLPF